MLRPEQMSKVSVTGAKRVMRDVIETAHDLNLLDISDYDGSWEEFEQGDPVEGAEEASDKLVTVRSIESILDVDAADAGPTRIVTEEALDEELAEVRERVNELDDRRDDLRSELRAVEEKQGSIAPFASLGFDLDLLSGYRSLQVAVGEGKAPEIEHALTDADSIGTFDLEVADGVVGIFARPTDDGDEDALSDALVGTDFTSYEVPDAEGSPAEYEKELEHREQQLTSKLRTVEDELEDLKLEVAGFLLAAEEKLSIDVQKTEAPLSFATTENAFIIEGWIPSAKYSEFAKTLDEAVDGHVEIEELERASFSARGHEAVREQVAGDGRPAAADGGEGEARADGGAVVMRNDDPPVVQDNPSGVRPFEVLVQAVGRPKYTELDPTVILFLTFPLFFGFMIGDVGYGILYTAIGYYLYSNFDSDAFRSMGGVTIFAGVSTTLFGVLYGELFGLHLITEWFWQGVVGLGHAPIEKGLSPATGEWALAWLMVSVLLGVLHLNVGYIFDFVENNEFHGFKEAMYESGSWILMLNGIWVWIFSSHYADTKPDFIYHVFNGEPFGLGFTGFPTVVGLVGLAVFAVGLVLLIVGSPIEAVEALNVVVNGLSYTRLAAVLLAKAGMAFTVNLLFFGVGAVETDHGAEWHFLISESPQHFLEHHEAASILFPGLMHGGAAAVLLGLVVLVLGHLLVLALGVTSAGLQAVRLEYVEFFGKFYEGGGKAYTPFGRERRFTTED
ncbi:MAG: V-type ATP synthase subunit I [Halobacteriota archaeon]